MSEPIQYGTAYFAPSRAALIGSSSLYHDRYGVRGAKVVIALQELRFRCVQMAGLFVTLLCYSYAISKILKVLP